MKALTILTSTIILTLLATLPLLANALTPAQPNAKTTVTINTNGDLTLTEEQNRQTWNPHTCGFTQATQATATFTDHTCTISINKTTLEPGHIATGAWWTTSFRTHQKPPLLGTHVQATFQACLTQATYQPPDEWLRIALATATQRADDTVVYTELDIYDTPNTQNHPTGNTQTGGNTIYTGADVIEYKTDQIPLNQWKNYTLDITANINRAWTLRQGDKLESVYIVIETANTPTQITLQIRNLWITQTS
jgi:hypothetical protein